MRIFKNLFIVKYNIYYVFFGDYISKTDQYLTLYNDKAATNYKLQRFFFVIL